MNDKIIGVVAPAITPGASTSEHAKITLAMSLTIAAAAVGATADVLAALQEAFPAWGWIAGAVACVGVLGTVLAALGYNKGRVMLKATQINAAATVVAAGAANPPSP